MLDCFYQQHVKGEEHRAFTRQKSNYGSLDALISQLPSTASFLQSVLLKHCVEKHVEPAGHRLLYVSCYFLNLVFFF